MFKRFCQKKKKIYVQKVFLYDVRDSNPKPCTYIMHCHYQLSYAHVDMFKRFCSSVLDLKLGSIHSNPNQVACTST